MILMYIYILKHYVIYTYIVCIYMIYFRKYMNTFIRKNHITFTSICIGIHSKASVLSNGYPYKRFLIILNKRKCNSLGQI